MVAASRGRAGEAEQRGPGCGIGVVLLLVRAVALAVGCDDSAVLVAPEVDLALSVGEGVGGELLDEAFGVRARALEDGHEGAERGAGDHVGGVLAGLQEDRHDDACVVPSLLRRSARPMFWTISTWEPRVSAKQTASTPRSPVMSTPSPRTRQLARNARCTRRPTASMPPANCLSTSRRSATRWSPHSHARHTLSGGTWRPASSS